MPAKLVWTPERLAVARQLWDARTNVDAMAAKFGCSKNVIYNLASLHRWPKRGLGVHRQAVRAVAARHTGRRPVPLPATNAPEPLYDGPALAPYDGQTLYTRCAALNAMMDRVLREHAPWRMRKSVDPASRR